MSMNQEPRALRKPPPSPPVAVKRAPSGVDAAAMAAGSVDALGSQAFRGPRQVPGQSQSMPGYWHAGVGPSAQVGASKEQAFREKEAYRLRTRYLHSRLSNTLTRDTDKARPKTINIPLSTMPGESSDSGDQGEATTAAQSSTVSLPAAASTHTEPALPSASADKGSLDAFQRRSIQHSGHDERFDHHHRMKTATVSQVMQQQQQAQRQHMSSQPMEIVRPGRDSEAILGFWDRRAAATSRRRHTTGGSPSPRDHLAWNRGGGSGAGGGRAESSHRSGALGPVGSIGRGNSFGTDDFSGSSGKSTGAGAGGAGSIGSSGREASGTYLTAAAVSRSRRTTAEMIGSRSIDRTGGHHRHHRGHLGHGNNGHRGRGDDDREEHLTGGASVESEGADLVAVVGALHLDSDAEEEDEVLDDAMMYGGMSEDVPSSPGGGASTSNRSSSAGRHGGGGGRQRGRYGFESRHSSNDDAVSRSSVTDDSDTECGSESAVSEVTLGGEFVGGRLQRHRRGGGVDAHRGGDRFSRASRFDRDFGERRRRHSVDSPFYDVAEEAGGADEEEGTGGRRGGFIPPHMMAEQQRGCFSMGYRQQFRPKPKEI